VGLLWPIEEDEQLFVEVVVMVPTESLLSEVLIPSGGGEVVFVIFVPITAPQLMCLVTRPLDLLSCSWVTGVWSVLVLLLLLCLLVDLWFLVFTWSLLSLLVVLESDIGETGCCCCCCGGIGGRSGSRGNRIKDTVACAAFD
jgi:hypothetical protein